MTLSAFAGRGYFNIWLVMAVSLLGYLAGDNLAFWISKKYGKVILNKIGFRRILNSEQFGWIEKRVKKYPKSIIFFSRFNDITTVSGNIVSGILDIPYRLFLLYDFLGELVQIFLFAGVGFYFGDSWPSVYKIYGNGAFFIVIFAIILLFVIYNLFRTLLINRIKGG
jgi:membrane-associated protein